MINVSILIENLRELASRELQEKLWLRGDDSRMSSFEEATCGVFDDAGLTRAMDSGYLQRTFSKEINMKINALSRLVTELPDNAHPKDLINHPKMEKTRELARELLVLFSDEKTEK